MSDEKDTSLDETARLFFACFFNLQQTTTDIWQNLDMTMAQFKVLLTLHVVGEVANSKLAEILNISHPTASHLVDKLVQASFVERNEHSIDRRYTLVRLTREGQTVVQHLRQGRIDYLRHWLAQLDESDRSALQQGLQALSRVIQVPSLEKNDHDYKQNDDVSS